MKGHWLVSGEQEEVIERLLGFELLKFSNARNLPLKSGGMTDIYINLRDARNRPEAIRFLARTFANPLFRLNPKRFVEVPDSVSCFAGPIAELLGMPYLTVRESEKKGRVAKAKVIGSAKYGERAVIIDDVVTDGASKIAPYEECLKMGLSVSDLVVLVDRQQGWKEKFAKEEVSLDVWSGMTLHDVRKYLIGKGAMERCDPEREEKNPIIVALDAKDWEEMLPIVDPLRTMGCIFKVNDLLFEKGFENLIPDLGTYGRVMADIKGHDIENTLKNIGNRLLKTPPWAVTVHASGSERMVRAVVDALKGTNTKVLAITVLTSIDKETCEEVYARQPKEEVMKLAEIAHRAGAHGLVCSSEEIEELHAKYPEFELTVPGVRSPETVVEGDDQKRVGTPAGAIARGAKYVVMGRQILRASDPVAEVQRVLRDELKVA